MIEYRGEDYKEVIDNKGLVLVDYFATWCGPCKMLMPVLEEMSNEVTEMPVYKVDIDKFRPLAIDSQIKSVPTLVLYKDGKEVARQSGYQPREKLEAWIEQYK
ncbi:Thioredoxin [Alteracholeplasma palmae J233]|uniref:Thioredoxin n=1 Tax=Alteracholeplasma palmae (strain ATCC 49389 / J233) TaxID=1318466 RepID=U4KQC7_ALTPJ|nr:thioredoxin [Alteracholeplasma palmae]CCV64505.1 Thioredoxin [Alteracholeplasma palmae J233]